jgi:hypothetical protein
MEPSTLISLDVGVSGLAGTVCICADETATVFKPIWFGAIFKLTRSTHVAAPRGAAKRTATAMPLVKAQCNKIESWSCLSFVLAVQTSRLRAPEADGYVILFCRYHAS